MTLHEFPWPSQQHVRDDYPTKVTDQPCDVCGEPIQPEQIYLVEGPRHIACSRVAGLVAERGNSA